MKRIHAFVYGEVQGVFFRANAKNTADKLNITGWVKNLSDGKVEVIAEGKEEDIKEFIKFINKGPKNAVVKKVEIKEEEYTEKFKDFKIIY